MSADDIEAVNTYIMEQKIKSPEAAKQKAAWITWYDNQNFISKALDSTYEHAANMRGVFNAANFQPADITNAADLSTEQKISRQSAIAASTALSPLQKKAALLKNPTIPTTPDVPASSTTRKTIKQGATGNDVAVWQNILGVKADGKFGPATTAATKAWQTKNGLTADGVVGPKSWSAATGTTIQEAPVKPVAMLPPVSQTFAAPRTAQAPLVSPSPAVHAAAVAKNPVAQPPVKGSSGTTAAVVAKKPFNSITAGLLVGAPATAGWFVLGPVGAVVGAAAGALFEVFAVK